jgi:hypothetical protein
MSFKKQHYYGSKDLNYIIEVMPESFYDCRGLSGRYMPKTEFLSGNIMFPIGNHIESNVLIRRKRSLGTARGFRACHHVGKWNWINPLLHQFTDGLADHLPHARLIAIHGGPGPTLFHELFSGGAG